MDSHQISFFLFIYSPIGLFGALLIFSMLYCFKTSTPIRTSLMTGSTVAFIQVVTIYILKDKLWMPGLEYVPGLVIAVPFIFGIAGLIFITILSIVSKKAFVYVRNNKTLEVSRLVLIDIFILVAYLIFLIANVNLYFGKAKIYGKYVDYDCVPIVDAKIAYYKYSFGPYAPYKGANITKTDSDGNFVIKLEKGDVFSIYETPDGKFSRRLFSGGRGFVWRRYDEIAELLKHNSKTNPLIIYKKEDHKPFGTLPANRRFRDKIRRCIGREVVLLSIPSTSRPIDLPWGGGPGSLIITSEEHQNSWHVDLSAIKGGIQSIDIGKLPFSEKLPEKGYIQAESIKISKNSKKPTIKAYYFQSQNGKAIGTFVINIDVISREKVIANNLRNLPSGGGHFLYINIFADLLGSRKKISSPVLQPEKCGGVLNRGHAGFYTRLPTLKK